MDSYKYIKTKRKYDLLLESGMFWECHPELTGDWQKDKIVIRGTKTCTKCNKNKRYIQNDWCADCLAKQGN